MAFSIVDMGCKGWKLASYVLFSLFDSIYNIDKYVYFQTKNICINLIVVFNILLFSYSFVICSELSLTTDKSILMWFLFINL